MALRATALAALVAATGCERLPAARGSVVWERELGYQGASLAGASDGDLFLVLDGAILDGAVSRLAPSGEVRWSVEGSYSTWLVAGPDDHIAVSRYTEVRPGLVQVTAIERLDGADGSRVALFDWPTTRGLWSGMAALSELTAIVGGRRRQDPDTGELLAGRVGYVELYDRAGQRVSLVEFDFFPEGMVAPDPRGGFLVAAWEVDGDTDLGLGPLAPGQAGVNFFAWFDDQGALVSQHLAPELERSEILLVGDDGAVYTGGVTRPGEPGAVLTRADETGAIVWELGVHGEAAALALTEAAGVDGDLLYAAGHLDGELGFGLVPDPAASGTETLPSDQASFLVSVEAATGAVRWQRGLTEPVEDRGLVADAAGGLYLIEGRWREFEDGAGYTDFLVARED